jgi:hypothetical protein
VCRIGVARLFEPDDRIVNPRLQQPRSPDLHIRKPDIRIVRAEADGLLGERNRVLISTR